MIDRSKGIMAAMAYLGRRPGYKFEHLGDRVKLFCAGIPGITVPWVLVEQYKFNDLEARAARAELAEAESRIKEAKGENYGKLK